MVNQTIENCGTLVACGTLGAYVLASLPHLAAILSVILLSLQIGSFIWVRIKRWRKNRGLKK